MNSSREWREWAAMRIGNFELRTVRETRDGLTIQLGATRHIIRFLSTETGRIGVVCAGRVEGEAELKSACAGLRTR